MATFTQIVNLNTKVEPRLEHILSKPDGIFSRQKIIIRKRWPFKRWYVLFYLRNPGNENWTGWKCVTGAQFVQNQEDRLPRCLSYTEKNLLQILKEGYKSFGDNNILLRQKGPNSLSRIKARQGLCQAIWKSLSKG